MGFMNWVVSKAMGLPSAGETCDRRVEEMLLHNGIRQHSVKMYRAEKSLTNPNLDYRYYIGDVSIAGVRHGVVIEIDENLARPSGYICEKPLSLNRDGLYRDFMGDRFRSGQARMFRSYIDRGATGARTELKPIPY